MTEQQRKHLDWLVFWLFGTALLVTAIASIT
jgi:hypothetical protein